MKIRIATVLLLLVVALPRLYARTLEESVDSNESTSSETVATSTVTASITTVTSAAPLPAERPAAPGWVHMVRLAAVAGPFAFLVLAWLVGAYLHLRLIRREQEQFPVLRGTRSPQWVPMVVSALLFFIPGILFVIFELRSRVELRLGIPGVVDEWQPVTQRAWLMLVVCLVLAIMPWLFARRADSVS